MLIFQGNSYSYITSCYWNTCKLVFTKTRTRLPRLVLVSKDPDRQPFRIHSTGQYSGSSITNILDRHVPSTTYKYHPALPHTQQTSYLKTGSVCKSVNVDYLHSTNFKLVGHYNHLTMADQAELQSLH